MRLRIKAAGKRAGVYVTPHMLRHTFATQLLNAGCDITSIQILMGHKRLKTTITYARVHDEAVARDYFRAMEQIEGSQQAVFGQNTATKKIQALLNDMVDGGLSDKQQQVLEELRRCLSPDSEPS